MENWKKAKGSDETKKANGSQETKEKANGSQETKEKANGSQETKEKANGSQKTKEKANGSQETKAKGREETKEAPGKSPRVASIDVFRGMALCLMIFANYGAGQYWAALVHATWDGITLSDFAFPL